MHVEVEHKKGILKYFVIIVLMVFFVILYVWQNVEVMNIKMEFREQVKLQKALIKDSDRIIYEIEKFKNMDKIEKYANEMGMELLTPDNFATIGMGKK